jgi:type I restriction enzyme S subunit
VKEQSGSLGHATISHAVHRGIVISDDLLRVNAIDAKQAGWIYAFLQTPQSRAMCTSTHYGHMIKHLQPSHLNAIPVPTVDGDTAKKFTKRLERIVAQRNEGPSVDLRLRKPDRTDDSSRLELIARVEEVLPSNILP